MSVAEDQIQARSARDTLRARLAPLRAHPALRAACESVAGAKGEATLSGLTPVAKGFVLAAVANDAGLPMLVLTHDNESADRLARTAATFLGWLGGRPDTIAALPAFDCSPYQGRSPHPEILERRALALWNIARGRTRLVVAPLASALGRFSEPSYYRSLALELKPGDELILADFAEHLAGIGYELSEPVTTPGQFSLRGGIVDVFPPEAEWPVRIEFFGDQIESLREFDPNSQRSRRAILSALILPLSEVKRSQGLFRA